MTDGTVVRWMCGINLQDRVPSKELRERLGLDDIISVLHQNRLQWYAHVQYEVEGARSRGRAKRTWREVVQKNCQAQKLNREDAMDRSRWRKLTKDG